MAACASAGDEATAALLDRMSGTVATLGDNAYPAGTPEDFAACYAPSWGGARKRTSPTPGNHDYVTVGAHGYFGYFGARWPATAGAATTAATWAGGTWRHRVRSSTLLLRPASYQWTFVPERGRAFTDSGSPCCR
jgi:hypothetical protein